MDKFLQEVFLKAKKESGEKSLKKWAEFIAYYLTEELKYPLSVKTLERYYNGDTIPNTEKKDKLANFLGYKDFRDYLSVKENFRNEGEMDEENATKAIGKNHRKYLSFIIGLISFSILGVVYLKYSIGSEDCMIWKNDHYEITPCEGKQGETVKIPYLLKNFRQINVTDTTSFFKNGKPNVWYDKHNYKLYYFSAPGINPETGKTVKEITPYMIDKYIRQR